MRLGARSTVACAPSSRRRPVARTTRRRRFIGCAANSTRPRRPTATRAGAASSRNRGWRCCASLKVSSRRGGQRDPPRGRRDASIGCSACDSCPRTSRSCWPWAILDEARAASRELDETASTLNTDVLTAIAAHARAAVQLAEGNALRRRGPAASRVRVWQQLGAPYLAARLRVLLARACVALGDIEGARLELEGAREVFERLGARPDLAAVEAIDASLAQRQQARPPTPRA